MAYRYHPEIEGLKVNEDGSEVLLNGKLIRIGSSSESRKHTYKYIIYQSKTIGIARLVCECWHGMPENSSLSVNRKDGNYENDHYTNLFWARHGGNSKIGIKLSENDKKEIKERLAKGDKQTEIAKDYKVSNNHISRLKKQFNKQLTNAKKGV